MVGLGGVCLCDALLYSVHYMILLGSKYEPNPKHTLIYVFSFLLTFILAFLVTYVYKTRAHTHARIENLKKIEEWNSLYNSRVRVVFSLVSFSVR